MRDKILLNGKIAVMQGQLENYKSEKQVFQTHIRQEDQQLKTLLKAVSESPMKQWRHLEDT